MSAPKLDTNELLGGTENLAVEPMFLCGIRVDPLREPDLLQLIDKALINEQKLLILNHNLHSLYCYETNLEFREAYEKASCVYIDGIPVVWLARAVGLAVGNEHRITFLDSFEKILREASSRGWRVFYLGSTEEVVEKGLAELRTRIPGLTISGRHGYMGDRAAEASAVAEVNAFGPDLLFVGMGMPLQEIFLAQYFADLKVTAALSCGGTLDYITGKGYRPPAWAGPLGLYGVCRLCSDPTRLWKRYLAEPLVLLWLIGNRLLQQRKEYRLRAPADVNAVS
jgi:N-acetylglucosaminyldiphosphoundecaprenol N-acetyl-beta-D-mannosaminyltransferase